MYLSRLVLNPRHAQARRDAGDCNELHRSLLTAFPWLAAGVPGGARAQFGLLYRLEEDPRTGWPVVIAQSRVEPDWSVLPVGYLAPAAAGVNPACKPLAAQYRAVSAGQVLRFRLRANPTKRCGKQGVLPGHRLALTSEAERIAWLERKAAGGGFELLKVASNTTPSSFMADVRADPGARQQGRRTGTDGMSMPLVFGSVLFEGLLRVTDAERLRATIAVGIGSGKAFGFGLLSIAPA